MVFNPTQINHQEGQMIEELQHEMGISPNRDERSRQEFISALRSHVMADMAAGMKRAWEGTQRTEIDIMENLGHAPWYVYNSFHYFKNVSATYGGDATFVKPRPSGQIYDGTDFSQDYHVYAVDWQPGKVTWYIDGQQVSVLENGEVNYEELYLMINLDMGGNWTNFPANAGGLGRSGNERFPNQNDLNNFKDPALEIDYVRVYRRR